MKKTINRGWSTILWSRVLNLEFLIDSHFETKSRILLESNGDKS